MTVLKKKTKKPLLKERREILELELKAKELEDSRRALMNILEDIEEARRRAEEEQKKTESVLTNFADGLLMFDNENSLTMVNRQAELFFGVVGRELIGQKAKDLAQTGLKYFFDLLEKEKTSELLRKELVVNEDLILEVSGVNIIREKEKIGFIFIFHNITREKAIERLKSEFVAITAHQLRTPLSAIKWALSMVLSNELGTINGDQREILQKGYSSNERMISLINDLLNIARIEEGRFIYSFATVDFNALLNNILADLAERIETKKMKIKILGESQAKPLADKDKLKLAVGNLIENAINYSPVDSEIIISFGVQKGEFLFSIKDRGIGIPAKQKARVFTRFFRSDNAVKTETQGTGLGLFITKNIVESHGGRIWFESEENKGTTFFFVLPAKAAETV